ncbi:MAG: hypothetical protein H7263_10425 [Candidatus Sericytochromatia bacterium]|nr:hypothetical protein [Candidatus Sericytochromatia bacterium]
MDRIKLLSEYGSFLKKNYLDQLAEENRQFLSKVNLHLIKSCQRCSVEDLLKMSLINLTDLLTAFEEGKVTEEIIADILKLELEALPGIKPEFIESNDLLSIYTAQKQALICFIPKFTSDNQVMMVLIEELEFTFLRSMDITLQVYINQRIESALAEGKAREKTDRYYIQELNVANEELKVSYGELRNQNENLKTLKEALLNRQEDLVSKEIELTRSNQSLNQFANMAFHDLVEPLRTVRQNVKLLAKSCKDNLDSNIKDFVGYIVDGVERMEHLTKSLYDFAKLNKLGVLVEFTHNESALERMKINLTTDVTNDKFLVKLSSVQLIQVFQNLLGNALTYRSPDTSAKIHIEVQKKGETWFFSVSDNGIGIKPKDFERVFIPVQIPQTIGEDERISPSLSFSKKTIHQYGGNMWVEYLPGKGTTFFFTIMES